MLLLFACRATMSSDAEGMGDPTAAWNSVLGLVVTPEGLVDYDRLERNRQALDEYVAWVGTPKAVPGRPDERLAFSLNAYNALVLFAVLEDGRPASVHDVPGRLFSKPGAGFFVERQFAVGNDLLSLYELEHERIRGRSQDYRVHGALNCASRSCPPLGSELFTGADLDAQLDVAMRRFVEDPERGVTVEEGTAVFSPIFDWYARDFTVWTVGKDLCAVAAKHARGPLASDLSALSKQGCPHRFRAYDWSLNDASR